MASKKRSTFIKSLVNFVFLVPTVISLIQKIIALIAIEAREIKKNVVALVICIFFTLILITSFWLCLLSYLFAVMYPHLGVNMSLLILVLVNVLLLIIIGIVVFIKMRRDLFFPMTRQQLTEIKFYLDQK